MRERKLTTLEQVLDLVKVMLDFNGTITLEGEFDLFDVGDVPILGDLPILGWFDDSNLTSITITGND